MNSAAGPVFWGDESRFGTSVSAANNYSAFHIQCGVTKNSQKTTVVIRGHACGVEISLIGESLPRMPKEFLQKNVQRAGAAEQNG